MCVFLLSEIEREMFGKKMKATYENSIVRKKEKKTHPENKPSPTPL